jgi:hypothetical protein
MKVITFVFCSRPVRCAQRGPGREPYQSKPSKEAEASQCAALERAYACGAINGGGALGTGASHGRLSGQRPGAISGASLRGTAGATCGRQGEQAVSNRAQ